MNESLEQRKGTIVALTWAYIAVYAFVNVVLFFIGCCQIVSSLSESGMDEAEADVQLDFFGIMQVSLLPFVVIISVLFFFYLRQLWKEIPSPFASTTPGKAAGYSLVPLFCCYWWFKSILGLVDDMNKFIVHHHCGSPLPTRAVALLCAFWVASHCYGLMGVFLPEDLLGLNILNALSIPVEICITCWGIYYLHSITLQFMDIKKSIENTA
ncbi:MAG: hypothetical protein LBN39_07245 [Planctomycetaceae bacterium]|jgi:hypothetical protein|nr:hypothetical protein [Planctomycetaceae bacterium]